MGEGKKMIRVMTILCLLFLTAIFYLTYIYLFKSKELVANNYNRRQYKIEENTVRGNIYDRNGNLLAYSENDGDQFRRVYPYGFVYSQVIGYNSRVYGKSLIESACNDELLGLSRYKEVFDMASGLNYPKRQGNNIYLSIDHELQVLGNELLDGKKGAIVAIDPKTGEVLALVSCPNFEPEAEKLERGWMDMVNSSDAPFLSRATQGLYAPGSIFKIITAAAALDGKLGEKIFNDEGYVLIDGRKIINSGEKSYGNIGIEKAFEVSSNVVYAQLGVEIGERNFKDIVSKAGIGKMQDFDIPVSKSRFPYDSMGRVDLAESAIGQGRVLVTPLQMAMITSGVANGGIMMKPFLVKGLEDPDGKTYKGLKSPGGTRIMTGKTAEKIKQMMQGVVDNGTGHGAAISGISVAGKTGTAENELSEGKKAKDHSWFVALAPVQEPQIVVAVIVEHGGAGGGVAAEIAREIIKKYLS